MMRQARNAALCLCASTLAVAGLVASCGSSSSGPGGSPDGGADRSSSGDAPADHPRGDSHRDGGPRDGSKDRGSGATDAPSDAPSADGPSDAPPTDASGECHEVQGDASTLYCTSFSGSMAGADCMVPGRTPGPCPSSGVTGCCLLTPGNAICFYASDSVPASTEKSMCMMGGGTWVTTPP